MKCCGLIVCSLVGLAAVLTLGGSLSAEESAKGSDYDHVRKLQSDAIAAGKAPWGHWGFDPENYRAWGTHSNRLIPVYTFGINLDSVRGANSAYRSEARLKELYGRVPENTLNPTADYFDQTDIYRLQKQAVEAGKKRVILMVFDGMDWQTTWAAATVAAGRVAYREGRGTGLHFQDYRGAETDYGYMVTAPHNEGTQVDVDGQVLLNPGGTQPGGYDYTRAGVTPWGRPKDLAYLIGKSSEVSHAYVDSAASATAMTTGVKTYNDSINVGPDGRQVPSIAHQLQEKGWAVGVVTSVPISHATPGAAYAHNVSRDDYQDISRDLLGLPSVAHKNDPLPGVDVLITAGWGVEAKADAKQGRNFVPGNRYLTAEDLYQVNAEHGGKYQVVQRTAGKPGAEILKAAAAEAKAKNRRLFGFFGVKYGHLPFRTADGKFNPTVGRGKAEEYTEADIVENPTLADMATVALDFLAARNPNGFWLMIEAGEVDWGNHDNNIDNSIGAVISGDNAFRAVTQWVEANGGWRDTALILTADHGHYLFLEQPEALLAK